VYHARALCAKLHEIVGYVPPLPLSKGMARAAAWYFEERRGKAVGVLRCGAGG
jgi:hypothetical protein